MGQRPDVVLWSASLVYRSGDELVHIMPKAKEPTDPIVDTITLRRENPEFFEAFRSYLTPRGALSTEPRSKTLVIRDVPRTVRALKAWVQAIDEQSR